jgi:hypothetical protein
MYRWNDGKNHVTPSGYFLEIVDRLNIRMHLMSAVLAFLIDALNHGFIPGI